MAGPDRRSFECQDKSLDLIQKAESLRNVVRGASSVWLVIREHNFGWEGVWLRPHVGKERKDPVVPLGGLC